MTEVHKNVFVSGLPAFACTDIDACGRWYSRFDAVVSILTPPLSSYKPLYDVVRLHSINDWSASRPRRLIQHKFVGVSDTPDAQFLPLLMPTVDFIRAATRSGKRVLVHCLHGSSRSVCVALCYVALSDVDVDRSLTTESSSKLSVDAALAHIHSRYKQASPSPFLVDQVRACVSYSHHCEQKKLQIQMHGTNLGMHNARSSSLYEDAVFWRVFGTVCFHALQPSGVKAQEDDVNSAYTNAAIENLLPFCVGLCQKITSRQHVRCVKCRTPLMPSDAIRQTVFGINKHEPKKPMKKRQQRWQQVPDKYGYNQFGDVYSCVVPANWMLRQASLMCIVMGTDGWTENTAKLRCEQCNARVGTVVVARNGNEAGNGNDKMLLFSLGKGTTEEVRCDEQQIHIHNLIRQPGSSRF